MVSLADQEEHQHETGPVRHKPFDAKSRSSGDCQSVVLLPRADATLIGPGAFVTKADLNSPCVCSRLCDCCSA